MYQFFFLISDYWIQGIQITVSLAILAIDIP